MQQTKLLAIGAACGAVMGALANHFNTMQSCLLAGIVTAVVIGAWLRNQQKHA